MAKLPKARYTLEFKIHAVGMVMSVADRVYVVEYGLNIADGTPEEVRSNPAGGNDFPRTPLMGKM